MSTTLPDEDASAPLRHARLLEYLRKHKLADIKSLAAAVGASATTVRRDLAELGSRGELSHTHDGPLSLDAGMNPHRRKNPLTGNWVLVSPHRAMRPWQGQQEPAQRRADVVFDPDCYLCAGNKRVTGQCNPAYTGTFVFQNDFAALTPDIQPAMNAIGAHEVFEKKSTSGTCRVICYSPHHSKTMPELEVGEIAAVIDEWCA